MMLEKMHAAAAFLRAKRLRKKLRTREDVEAWQRKKIAAWLNDSVRGVPYYRDRPHHSLADLPIINKQIMMDDFAEFNHAEISLQDVRACVEGRKPIPGFHCGMSTGTSGNRTYYIISDKERFIWLGTMLGKLLPSYPFVSARIAVALPMATPLYQSANHLWRLKLQFFNLNDGLEKVAKGIEAFRPDSLIAPPHLLRYLAEANMRLPLKRLYSAGEVLDPFDRDIIANHFAMRIDEIYMASEGLLATPCRHGRLHLCEDVMYFEFEKENDDGLINPIITDFTRHTQIMARYRLNDLLRLDDRPCPCGCPYQTVAEIIGRKDDCFHLRNKNGRMVTLTPDILRNAILDSAPQIADFRLIRAPDGEILLQLPALYGEAIGKDAVRQLTALFSRFNIVHSISLGVLKAAPLHGRKLRRIENQYKRDGNGFL